MRAMGTGRVAFYEVQVLVQAMPEQGDAKAVRRAPRDQGRQPALPHAEQGQRARRQEVQRGRQRHLALVAQVCGVDIAAQQNRPDERGSRAAAHRKRKEQQQVPLRSQVLPEECELVPQGRHGRLR